LTCSVIVIAVELLQFITLAGSCDIDDLILNVSGAFLVYLAAKTKNIEKFLRFAFLMEK
ncbi:MAG: VanZ family protein, partial [Oscillospiraceae bacterium]|nr:VanZ family protein [Oscillospiraceae bacterium]